MTPAEINAKIADWLGFKPQHYCHAATDWLTENSWFDGVERNYARAVDGLPNWYTTNAAMDLLPELANRGYCPALIFDDNGRWTLSLSCIMSGVEGSGPIDVQAAFFVNKDEWKETPSAAICYAILQLTEQEGQ